MNNIYNIVMSFKFLIQATRVLQVNNYDKDELKMIFNYAISLDRDTLIEYYNNCTIIGFKSDLHLYLEIVENMIRIFEELEEYEKCYVLKNKKEETIEIMTTMKSNYYD